MLPKPLLQRSLPLAGLALLVVAALVAPSNEAPPAASPEVVEAVANTEPMTWSAGNYWSYQTTFPSGKVRDIALVVSEARADGFKLGSNVSAGFFGFPFNGNLTPDLNPEIAGEVWPMFSFPLSDGASWSYEIFGYTATTVARATVLDVPGIGEHAGFRLEASSYGRVFASYDYSPVANFLTRIEIIEPTTGERLLHAQLIEFGTAFGAGYFVQDVIADIRLDYPADLPGVASVGIRDGYAKLHATLLAKASVGTTVARLEDARGRLLLDARQVGEGGALDSATLPGGADTWTLRHVGVGEGGVRLQITGVRATGMAGAAAQAERIDLAALLQSTLPARPHTGQTTSTGWPVAV